MPSPVSPPIFRAKSIDKLYRGIQRLYQAYLSLEVAHDRKERSKMQEERVAQALENKKRGSRKTSFAASVD
jgi:hypothetical protein